MLDWMLVPLLLLWPLSVTLTWLIAQNIANKPHDRELEYLVQAVARELMRSAEGTAPARVGLRFSAEALLAGQTDGHRQIQVLGLQGELVVGNAALPLPPRELSELDPVDKGTVNERILLADVEVNDVPMRVAWMWLPERVEQPGEQAPLVQVAETLSERSLLATEVLKGVLLPQYAILPLAVLLVWMALTRGLAPLEALQRRIRARRSQDLSPIDQRDAPEEVAPLVSAINDLLSRLEQSVATQKRFLADAAHQLKTPLAGLRMQAELAHREMVHGGEAEQARRSLQQISRASQNATRMVNQLLAMARAEDPEQALRRQRVDLQAIAFETVEDFVQRALDLRIDLGYEAPPPAPPGRAPLELLGQPVLIRELVRNLVDNALNYTPSGGTVTVRVLHDHYGRVAVLQVEDTGVGIAEAERELVFQPFYRALGTEVDGSGLGLAIVREIVARHGGVISVEDARTRGPGVSHPGTRFSVRFNAAPRA
ncbi:MAG: sensor histidine kinase [Betaproteobacteria bacterium]|nr:sensor histidine kinase [Betaproteobacteria bacterium]NBU50065.1 sensor histidine kinase [Betaproteobacteria bacterium]